MSRVLRIQRPFTTQDLETGLLHPDESVRKGWKALQRVTEGWEAARIGAEIGWSVTWVRTRVRRFNKDGPDSLLDGRVRNGRKPDISPEIQERLKNALNENPPFYGTAWNGPLVARWLKEKENVHVGLSTGNKWLHRLGYQLVPRSRAKSTAPTPKSQGTTDIPAPAPQARREATSCAVGGSEIVPPALPHRPAYPSDLTDAEWKIYAEYLKDEINNKTRRYDVREIVNAILYVLKTGCQWRYLPHDFPPHGVVFNSFRRWSWNGIWEKIHDNTRERLRKKHGREAKPSLGIADTQSVKTTEKGGSVDMTVERR